MSESARRGSASDREPSTAPGLGRALIEAAFVFLVLLVFFQALYGSSRVTIFAERDLDRAARLLRGEAIFFGPEASGGGHLPGNFYYLVLAFLERLGCGWKGIWETQMAFAAAAIALLWAFARRRFGLVSALFGFACAGCLDFMTMHFGYNAGFTPLFVVAAAIAACLAYDAECRRRGAAWIAFASICALGVQFHYTFALLAASGLLLQLLAPSLRLRRLERRAFVGGIAAFAALLAPYGAWCVAAALSRRVGQQDLPFTNADLSQGGKLFGIAMYAIKSKGVLPAAVLARRTLRLIPFEAALPLLAYALRRGARAAERGAGQGPPAFVASSLSVLAVCAAATAFPYLMALALLPTRYSVVPRLVLDLLACALLADRGPLAEGTDIRVRVLAGTCLVAVAWRLALFPSRLLPLPLFGAAVAAAAGVAMAAAARGAGPAEAPRSVRVLALLLPAMLLLVVRDTALADSSDDFPGAEDLKTMSELVYRRTGWDYDEARLRLFYLNIRDIMTPAPLYRDAEKEGRPPRAPGDDRVDGFFVALAPPDGAGRAVAEDPKSWIPLLSPPSALSAGIADGGVALGRPLEAGRLLLVPYVVADRERLPARFHNASEGYAGTGPWPGFATEAGARSFRFRFNDCPRHDAWCDVFADVRVRPRPAGRWLVDVVLSGEPLSQASLGVNMSWNERLSRPYFFAQCGGRRRSFLLADYVGIKPEVDRAMNRSLLGPYERSFHVDCGGPPERIGAGYEAAAAYAGAVLSAPSLPARELSSRWAR